MLAIVIPYYKNAFFEETLMSLIKQKNKNFNVYIGNDASPDNPESIIQKYKGQLNIQYQKFDENIGSVSLTAHWVRCLEMVQEEQWIMILGDDDVLTENVVESWFKYYTQFENKINVFRFATRIINENLEFTSDIFSHPKIEKAEDSFYRKFRMLTRSSLSEYVFLKEAYLRNGFTDYLLAWHSDDKAWLDFSENNPIYSINEALVLIRNSSLNISGKMDNLLQKNLATKTFYRDVIFNYLPLFNRSQKFLLLRAYENILEKTKTLGFKEAFVLLYFYSRYYNNLQFKKYLRRSFNRYKSK